MTDSLKTKTNQGHDFSDFSEPLTFKIYSETLKSVSDKQIPSKHTSNVP